MNTNISNLSVCKGSLSPWINLSFSYGGARAPKGLRTGSWTPAFASRRKIAQGPPLRPLLLGVCRRTTRNKLQQGCSQFAGPTGAQHQPHEPKDVRSAGAGAWAPQPSSPAAVIPVALGLKSVFLYAGRSATAQPEEMFPIQEYTGA